jgi:hypothetical protein
MVRRYLIRAPGLERFEGSGERTESRKMVKIDGSLEAGMNCAHFIEIKRRTNEG